MALFGWCLPDMDIEQHSKCTTSFDSTTCHCMCHVDMALFTKEYNAKNNLKPAKASAKKRQAPAKSRTKISSPKPIATKATKAEEESWQSTSSMLTELVHTANLKSQQLMNEQQLN